MRSIKTKTTLLGVLLFGASAWQACAQPAFDSSGDGQLNGAFYMRQVFYFVSDTAGDLGDATNIQGTITFSGNGTYTFSGSLLDFASGSSTPTTFTGSGTYAVSASGEGYISAINPSFPNDRIIGLASHGGIFIGSSTENSNGYNDLFIAAPVGSTATNATLTGGYQVAYFDPTFPGDALLSFNANGAGNIGNITVAGYTSTNTTVSNETLSGVTYSFNNGAAQINFGGTASSSNLIGGTDLLYISPDGNFIFGGSYNGFDMFAGVRNATTTPTTYDNLYYQAGLDLNEGTVSAGYTILDSYFGSAQLFSQNIIGHERDNAPLIYGGSADYTYYDSYTLNANGSSSDSYYSYWSTPDGTIRIGSGPGPYLGLNISLQAPALSGSGVYLSPVGVVNAASSAPFTAFLSPGEFLTLYGSGLAATTDSASVPFPTNLSGVQVLINQIQAPIYYVSPTQISVVVPYITTPQSIAQIQVVNNSKNSNVVTQFTGSTSVGIFTNNPVGGIGYAAAERPDGSVISESNPAQIGETEALYLAGMGAVSPAVPDGTAAPSATLANTTATPQVYIADTAGNYTQATVTFSGLAPGFAGLYQIDFTIPSGVASGDTELDIYSGVDSESIEALLPVGTATAAASPTARAKALLHRPALRPHALRPARFSAIPPSSVSLRSRE